jgi:hypothetical protein
VVKVSFQRSLKDTYNAGSFFSSFDLFSGPDPTGGFVNYQGSLTSAQSSGLLNTNNNQIYRGVNYTSTLNTSFSGRTSIRITSNKAHSRGLFIADVAHMPGSICGLVFSADFCSLWMTLHGNESAKRRWIIKGKAKKLLQGPICRLIRIGHKTSMWWI